MQNECTECGAKLKIEQAECTYCGTAFVDENERLLNELTNLARRFNQAFARANLLEIEKLLADEYVGQLKDAGTVSVSRKPDILESVRRDENFVSYNIHDEELIERVSHRAKIYCVQTVTRRSHFEKNKFEPYIERGTIDFVERDGRWQIAGQQTVTIDENGNEYE